MTARMTRARALYLAVYESQGGQWEANDCKELWCDMADRYLELCGSVAQRSGDPLAGLDERLDRLCLTSTENNRVFVLATESARNIVEIVREWLRSGAGYSLPSTMQLCPDWRTCKCKDGCAHSSTNGNTP